MDDIFYKIFNYKLIIQNLLYLFQELCKFKNITSLDITCETQFYPKYFLTRDKASRNEPLKLPKTLRSFGLIHTDIVDFRFLYSLTELTYLEFYEKNLNDQILSIISASCTKLEVLVLGNDYGKFLFF